MKTVVTPNAKLDLMAAHMKEAVEARGIATCIKQVQGEKNSSTWLSFTLHGQEFFYANGMMLEYGTDKWGRVGRNVNHRATLLVADKHKAKTYLASKGFSVPTGKVFRRKKIEDAYQAFDAFSGPICVKPNRGSLGRCVYPALKDRNWYQDAINRVAEKYQNILIEESVEGGHFRFFYVQPEVVGIRHGIPTSVVGDGISTLEELSKTKNAERIRRNLPTHPPFPLDEDVHTFLARQGRSLDDVPAVAETVFLKGVSNAPAGADSFLRWDEVHPSYREVVEQACKTVPGLLFSGVDIIIRDISEPAKAGNYWILEMNTSPAITSFYYPWEGDTVDVASDIVDLLLEHYQPASHSN